MFISALKYNGDLSYLPILAQLMSAAVAERLARGPMPDFLVPMPMHWWRRWRRGFNQAELMARCLCQHRGLQAWPLRVDSSLCCRRRATRSQLGLDAAARLRNLHDVLYCPHRVDGLNLAIVDDVMTTGASANAMASALLTAGARRVEVWCCARTPEPVAAAR